MTLWMKVTKDEYELPLVVCGTLTQLAKECGVPKGDISMAISRYNSGRIKHTAYRKVEVDAALEPGDAEELDYIAKQDARPAYRGRGRKKKQKIEIKAEVDVKTEHKYQCDYCDYCTAVILADGSDDTRVCTRFTRLIDDSEMWAPDWCPLMRMERDA